MALLDLFGEISLLVDLLEKTFVSFSFLSVGQALKKVLRLVHFQPIDLLDLRRTPAARGKRRSAERERRSSHLLIEGVVDQFDLSAQQFVLQLKISNGLQIRREVFIEKRKRFFLCSCRGETSALHLFQNLTTSPLHAQGKKCSFSFLF